MIEKNSCINLTEEDVSLYNKGLVSDRLKSLWNLDLDSLREIIESHNYTLLKSTNDQY